MINIWLGVFLTCLAIYLLVAIKKGKPIIQKVNNIVMEGRVEDMRINYNKIIYIIILLLAATLILTAVNVYVYTQEKLEDSPAINNSSNQTVNVNVNKDDEDFIKFDLNNATREELESLPGVGKVLADRIISSRPFYSVEELKNVDGIGETTYVKLRGYVVVVGYD